MSHEIAEGIWEKTGTVLYTIDGNDYLIVVDYFSNFWEIDHLIDTKASTVIRKLKCHFARQGVPQVVISDNGLQFACKQFTFFANQWVSNTGQEALDVSKPTERLKQPSNKLSVS